MVYIYHFGAAEHYSSELCDRAGDRAGDSSQSPTRMAINLGIAAAFCTSQPSRYDRGSQNAGREALWK